MTIDPISICVIIWPVAFLSAAYVMTFKFSDLSLLLCAVRALVCSILLLVLIGGGAHASTLSLTHTAGGLTLVGEPDAVLSFSFGSGSGNFVEHFGTLSPLILQDVTNGTTLFEVDLTGTGIGDLAFQNVLFTAYSVGAIGGNAVETVSFNYSTLNITPAPVPLPAALPLCATGLGTLGLLGWRRKRRAAAIPA
jgi:hypothetical protein